MAKNAPSTPDTKPQPVPPDADARRIIRMGLKASLGTLRSGTGDPYVSLVTVATASCGAPLILISKLAVHTQNLLANPRASLLFDATNATGDPLAGGRVTISGRAVKTTDPNARRRFLARLPAAELYADFPDFAFYKFEIESAHYIGGFGRIVDLTASQMRVETEGADQLATAEAEILDHMNTDHTDAVALYAQFFGAAAAPWRITGLDPDGFDLVYAGQAVRLPFGVRVTTADGARQEFVRIAQAARARLANA